MEAHAALWQESFRVRSYEVAPGGQAPIRTICNYLQEAAANHARHLGVARIQDGTRMLAWVLSRLRIEMTSFPAWRERVVVETWPSGENGLLSTRDFVLRNDQGLSIGHAISAWFLLDLEKRRPVRSPPEVRAIRLPTMPRAIPHELRPIQFPDGDSRIHVFSVRHADLDMNEHVNNVRYVEWALEAARAMSTEPVTGLDIRYFAEVTLDEIVDVATIPTADPDPEQAADWSVTQRLTRRSDGKELARLRLRW